MARIRSIKPEAFQSETLGTVSVEAERTFFGLSTQVDDRGRHRDSAAVINGVLWALRPEHTPVELEAELSELERAGLVCRYVGCDGRRYLHLTSWDQHQVINRPSRSRLPRCPEHGADDYCGRHPGDCPSVNPPATPPSAQRTLTEDSVSAQGALDAGSRTVDRGSRTVDSREASPPSSEIAERSSDPPPAPNPSSPRRPDVERLCAHLADRIEANGSKRPTVGRRWREAARLMLDRDGRTEDQVHVAIDWCQDDEFWRANVLSMSKLRDQYDRLRLAAQRARASPAGAIDHRQQAVDRQFDRAMQRATAKENASEEGFP